MTSEPTAEAVCATCNGRRRIDVTTAEDHASAPLQYNFTVRSKDEPCPDCRGGCAQPSCPSPSLFEIWGQTGFEDYVTVCAPHVAVFLDPEDSLHVIGYETSVEEMVHGHR